MNLEILSMGAARKFVPKDRTHLIRIFNAFDHPMYFPLDNHEDFASVENYYFDDMWPRDFKEYSWLDFEGSKFKDEWESLQKMHPKMTEASYRGYLEVKGHPEGRCTVFNSDIASKIIKDFEEVKDNIDTVVVHCMKGVSRSPAVGIFMNEKYGWGHEGLKEKFWDYRRFVYETMKASFLEKKPR